MNMVCITLAAVVALTLNGRPAAGQTGSTPAPATTTRPSNARVTKVMHGTLEHVDAGAKTMAVRTADGSRTVLRYTDGTAVHGAEASGKAVGLTGKEGAHVVVHYTDEGARRAGRAGARAAEDGRKDVREGGEKTAHAVAVVGKETVSLAEGTIVAVDRGARTVAIDTARGTREVFRLGEGYTIDAAHGIERVAADSGRAVARGAHVVVYYTERGGEKIAHGIDEAVHGR
jgi:hypothetical protein